MENDQLKNEIVQLKDALQKFIPQEDNSQQIHELSPILVGLIPNLVYAIATSTASQPCFHFPVKAKKSPNNDFFKLTQFV